MNTAATAQVYDNGVIKQARELRAGDKVFLAPTDRNKEVILEQLRPLLNESKYGTTTSLLCSALVSTWHEWLRSF